MRAAAILCVASPPFPFPSLRTPPPPSAFGSPSARPGPRGRWQQPNKPGWGGVVRRRRRGATLKMAACGDPLWRAGRARGGVRG